jgi:hypothetical protein
MGRVHVLVSISIATLLSLMLVAPFVSDNARAWMPMENTWIADAPGFASTDSNWENGTPYMDQTLWFDGDHSANCTWDIVDESMAWGINYGRFQELRLAGYEGHIIVVTPIYLINWDWVGPVPPDPNDHTTYPGPMDWLTMSLGMSLLITLLMAGMIFILLIWLISRRR